MATKAAHREPMEIGRRLSFVCALAAIASPAAAASGPPLEAASFAYAVSHSLKPLPSEVIARTINTDGHDSDEADAFDEPHFTRVDVRIGAPRAISRNGMCSVVAGVARVHGLPVPFFANLIWQESAFGVSAISHAGALGVAQFMPETAQEHGLINPFEPIHALHSAGRLLRRLAASFGDNLGLAAAAYNAGPRRVSDWMARRGGLPTETRNYVVRITGNAAEQWTSREFARGVEATLMPARAPCAEVAAAVEVQTKVVRVARLMSDLAAATRPPPPPEPDNDTFDEQAWKVATAKPGWHAHALAVARGVVKNIREESRREARERRILQAWHRVAGRTMKKAALAFAQADDRDKKTAPAKTKKRTAEKAAEPRPQSTSRKTRLAAER
jgi:hypothetical protein